jgi:type I restriction enzyme R subunit
MRQSWESDDKRAAELGLNEEELAFYDAVATKYNDIYGQELLRDLIHDVVMTIKRSLKVDWAAPHRDDVKAGIRAAVRRVLKRRNIKPEDFDEFVINIMAQAEALYSNWPLAA